MKKFFTIFFVFLVLSFSINTITTVAQPKIFSEGFYYPKDLNIMENVNPTVQNVSTKFESFMIIFDDKDRIQQAVRLKPNSPKHILLPVKNSYKVTIVGDGELSFS